MIKKTVITIFALLLISPVIPIRTEGQENGALPTVEMPKDLKIGFTGYGAIKFFFDHKLVKGYSDGEVKPEKAISRAEAVLFAEKAVILFDEYGKNPMEKIDLLKFETSPAAHTAGEKIFSDMGTDHWAAAGIQRAVNRKIINGYKDGTFKPDKEMSLVEGLKILLESEKIRDEKMLLEEPKETLFNDSDHTAWYGKYVKKAKEKNMLRFGFKNMIEPDQTLSREYFMDLTYRLLKSRDENRFFGKASFYSDFFEGKGTSNGETFTQNDFTAAHKTLPFNTYIRVTNLKNGQHVDVRINDRGPFNISLDVDLTSSAFKKIASPKEGIVPVQYEILR